MPKVLQETLEIKAKPTQIDTLMEEIALHITEVQKTREAVMKTIETPPSENDYREDGTSFSATNLRPSLLDD